MTTAVPLANTTIQVDGLGRAIDGQALYNNPIAIAEGDSTMDLLGLKGINPGALSIGGTGILGNGTQADVNGGVLTVPFLHFNDLTISSSVTPSLLNDSCVWYVKGDFTLDAGQTISLNAVSARTRVFDPEGIVNEREPADSGFGDRGGGGHPLGGQGSTSGGDLGYDLLSAGGRDTWREWNCRPYPGVSGVDATGGRRNAGGAIVILCDGVITINGTIDASGQDGDADDGAGGGGCIILISLTQITGNGTLDVTGGVGGNSRRAGGGYVQTLAPDFTGEAFTVPTQTSGSAFGSEPRFYTAEAGWTIAKTREEIRNAVFAQGMNNWNRLIAVEDN